MPDPADLDPETAWMWRARCRGMSADESNRIFFLEPGESAREAKALCVNCPVVADCLTFALKTDQRHGIWGGLTDGERDQIKRGRRRVHIMVCHGCGYRFIPGKNGTQQRYCAVECRKRMEARRLSEKRLLQKAQ